MKRYVVVVAGVCLVGLATVMFAIPRDKPVTFLPAIAPVPASSPPETSASFLPVSLVVDAGSRGATQRPSSRGGAAVRHSHHSPVSRP